jgi:hypothetical protein
LSRHAQAPELIGGSRLNAGNDRIAASVERDGTTIDLGEAAGSDPLSTAAREVLDDVQLPETQRTVCR